LQTNKKSQVLLLLSSPFVFLSLFLSVVACQQNEQVIASKSLKTIMFLLFSSLL